MTWRVFAGRATGKAHIDGGVPCQDAYHHVVRDGLLVAAVCDGAGSQPRSDEGAAAVSRAVVETVATVLAALSPLATLDDDSMASIVAAAVDGAREALATIAAADGHGLAQFAATLVGVACDGERGWFFHIGDGVGVAEPCSADGAAALSLPENGEYANETWFVTGDDWRAHLRVQSLPEPVRRIALMSDGAAAFVMAKGGEALFAPFVDPVERFLLAVEDPAQADAALAATLDDPRTHAITGDDKALVLAIRG